MHEQFWINFVFKQFDYNRNKLHKFLGQFCDKQNKFDYKFQLNAILFLLETFPNKIQINQN